MFTILPHTERPIKIAIGIPTLFPYIHKEFFRSFLGLVHQHPFEIMTSSGTITSVARNRIVAGAIQKGCSHVMFLDADMTHPADTIVKLLAHDKDIVAGVYVSRWPPHDHTAMILADNQPMLGTRFKRAELTNELMEVHATGTGCLLIKVDVFKRLKPPYFEYQTKGDMHYTEDVVFCLRARTQGFKIYLDPTIKCGHITDQILEVDGFKP